MSGSVDDVSGYNHLRHSGRFLINTIVEVRSDASRGEPFYHIVPNGRGEAIEAVDESVHALLHATQRRVTFGQVAYVEELGEYCSLITECGGDY